MNLETSFFNSQMTNFFIGLFHNHVLLKPYSNLIYQLGYSIHSIEPKFDSQGNTINPEAIVCSSSRQHVLLTEWTNAKELSAEKKQQIADYLNISQTDLINNAKIAVEACKFHSLLVVVSPTSLSSFEEIVNLTNTNNLILCSFGQMETNEYFISFHSGNILDSKLSSIFTKIIKVSRIPNSYIPIPLDNLKDKQFTDGVFREVMSFYIKQRYEFSVKDICQSMLNIWSYLGSEKQTSIENAVKRVMCNISKITISSNESWLVYSKDLAQWEIRDLSRSNFDKICDYMKNNKISFYE